jgi:ubiquinone biosynthesis protein COQ4
MPMRRRPRAHLTLRRRRRWVREPRVRRGFAGGEDGSGVGVGVATAREYRAGVDPLPAERHAVGMQLSTPSSSLRDAYLVGRAVVRVLGDSNQTQEIHRVEEITGRPKYRRLLAEVMDSPEGRELLRDRPELRSDMVDYPALGRLPPDTLGARYVHHLESNGITADYQAAPTRHVQDPDMAYLMRRFRQTHDVGHALLELGTQGHEEVIIHAFSWGQLRLPVSAMVLFFGTLKHIVLERRWVALRRALDEANRIGRDAAPLLPVYWEKMWSTPIADVRERYGLRTCTRAFVDGK